MALSIVTFWEAVSARSCLAALGSGRWGRRDSGGEQRLRLGQREATWGGGILEGKGCKSRRVPRGVQKGWGPARLRRQKRPEGWGPAGVLGSHGPGSAGTRKPKRGSTDALPQQNPARTRAWGMAPQGGAERGLDSRRRAPTRFERLSASSLWPPRALKGSAGELGRKAGGLALGKGVRARDPWVPRVSPDLSKFGRGDLPGT